MSNQRRNRLHDARYFVVVLLLATISGGLWMGCDKSPPQAKRGAVIVISGDTAGWIVPCGCTANQSGGLLRRGTYLKQLRQTQDVLYLDVGGAAAGNSPYQQAKLEAILTGENTMELAAQNLGKNELSIDPAKLKEIAEATHTPFVSANTHLADGSSIAPAIRVFPFGGKKVAVIGVVSPIYATPEILVSDPRQAIVDTAAHHKGEYDALLVLAYLPEMELEQLAAATPEADAIVGGPTGQSIVPRRVGPALLASATNKGKFLVRVSPPADSSQQWTGEVVEMGPTISDDAGQFANLHNYLDKLRVRDFTAEESGFAAILPAGAPKDYRVAGSASCISCHADVNTIWAHSLHAQAVAALQPRGFDVDPDCLRCHTTAYGLPGGFDSPDRTPALVGVGCESCHGPSAAHVANPKVRTVYAAFDQCISCHDHENSPMFNRDIYWAKIRHGKSATRPSDLKPSLSTRGEGLGEGSYLSIEIEEPSPLPSPWVQGEGAGDSGVTQ